METNEDTPEEPTPDGKKEVVREASVARVEPVQVMPESPVKEAAVAKTAQVCCCFVIFHNFILKMLTKFKKKEIEK